MNTHLSPIKIALFGMDQRSQKMMQMVLLQKLEGICSISVPEEADVALVDLDGKNSQEELLLLQSKFANLPKILMSLRPAKSEDAQVLRKPISTSSLLTSLHVLFAERFAGQVVNGGGTISPTPSGQAYHAAVESSQPRDIKVTQLADALDTRTVKMKEAKSKIDFFQSDEIFFSPEEYIIWQIRNHLRSKAYKNKIIEISISNNKSIYADIANKKIVTELTDNNIRTLGLTAQNAKNKTQIHVKKIIELPYTGGTEGYKYRSLSVDQFLWKLAIATSRGRIPKQLFDQETFVCDKPVYITRWPNLTRLTRIPNAKRLIAYWLQNPATLSNLSKLLKIDEEHINNLFFANVCIANAGQAMRQSDQMLEAESYRPHRLRKVFHSIIKHLKND